MTETNYLTQTQLAERWQVAESTLERWRSEGIGPIYMKMMGWAAAGFKDTLLRCQMKKEVANGDEKKIQPGVQA